MKVKIMQSGSTLVLNNFK